GVPKVVLSGRNLSPKHFALFQDYFLPVYRALADSSHVVLVNNSRAGADDYADWIGIPRDRIAVIRNGVEFTEGMRPIAAETANLRNQLKIPARVPVIGGMFRFNPEKRPLLWLKAARQVASVLPDAHFVLFGQGEMRTEIEELAQSLGIAERLRMS